MPSHPSVAGSGGYVVTEKGSHDLRVADQCACNPRLAGLLIECPECGTVYGSLREDFGRPSHMYDKKR